MRHRYWKSVCLGLCMTGLAVVAIGCGNSSSGAKVRLVNANPDQAGLNLLVDDATIASSIAYGSASSYSGVSSGSRDVLVESSGSSTSIIDTTLTFSAGSTVSLISANYSYNVRSIVLSDDNTAPPSGDFKLRIVNASPGMGAQDVYVVTSGTDINSSNPVFSSLGFGSASSYVTLGAGSYDVIFTPPGSKFINLTSSYTLSAGQIRTVLSLNNPSGSYMAAALSDLN